MRRAWAPSIAIALFAVIQVFGFGFARMEADRAIREGKEAAVAEAEREALRADEAICRIARTNRIATVGFIEAFKVYISAQPPSDPAERAAVLAALDAEIADARLPFPEPCAAFSL